MTIIQSGLEIVRDITNITSLWGMCLQALVFILILEGSGALFIAS